MTGQEPTSGAKGESILLAWTENEVVSKKEIGVLLPKVWCMGIGEVREEKKQISSRMP